MLRKRGKYWHYQFDIDGITYWGSTKETVRSKADTFEAMRKVEVRQRTGNVGLRRAPILKEFAMRFFEFNLNKVKAGHLTASTCQTYRSGWRLLSETNVAHMRMDHIRTSDAAVLSFPGGPSNANQALRTLSRMLSYAAEEGILHAVPRIKLRREYGREAIIDPRTESLLLKFAPAPLGDVLVIMLDCGMRPEEVLRMRWEHIYWDRKRLLVPYGKSSRSTRLLPLSERMEVRLKARQSDSEWVFPSMQVTRRKSRSQSGHRSSVGTQWLDTVVTVNAEAEKHGVSPVSSAVVLYSARHTFATRYLDEGGDIASLMKLLGHSGLRTTQRYLHPEIEKAAAIVNRRNNRAFQLPDALSDDALDRDAEAFSSLAERFDGLGMG